MFHYLYIYIYSYYFVISTIEDNMLYFQFLLFFSRNIVSTVNLDCALDLKKIAQQARNAEYNPKVLFLAIHWIIYFESNRSFWYMWFPYWYYNANVAAAFFCCHHEDKGTKNNSFDICFWKDGEYHSTFENSISVNCSLLFMPVDCAENVAFYLITLHPFYFSPFKHFFNFSQKIYEIIYMNMLI